MSQELSGREREILVLASEGLTDKEIALKLGVSAATVKTYWERLRAKTDTPSRGSAILKVLGGELRKALADANEAREDRDTLLEQAGIFAIFSFGPNRKIQDWNPTIRTVLGFEPKEFIGADFSVIFTQDDIEKKQPEFEIEQATAHGKHVEHRYHLRKDNTHVWVEGTLVAFRNEDGSIRKFSKILRDETVKKSLETEIQRLQAGHFEDKRASPPRK